MKPDNPLWGEGWEEVRAHWALDQEVAYLNHGSFGACPRPVLDAQAALRAEMEREPVLFLDRRHAGLVAAARERSASFLGASPDGFAFVVNATSAVSTVIASLPLAPGEEIVVTDHAYPAVRKAVGRACAASGARVVEAAIPLPLPGASEIVDAICERIGKRTRLVVVDQVTSESAAILPVADVVAACRARDVPVLVDGAHAPGMLPLTVDALGADYWCGNFHKWVCAPKGSAALVARAGRREALHPLVTSHGAGRGLHAEFDWTGTFDPTAWLAVPAAIEFMGSLGWERLRAYNHELAALGRALVAGAVGTAQQVPDEAFGSMSLVALPPDVAGAEDSARALQARLFDAARVEVPVVARQGRGYLRLSAQAYNCPADYERLAAALPGLL